MEKDSVFVENSRDIGSIYLIINHVSQKNIKYEMKVWITAQ